MIYRMINQFLEIWFQNLDAWVMFYRRLPDDEHKMSFILATKEMMEGFLDTLEEIEFEPMNNLTPIQEEKEESKDASN